MPRRLTPVEELFAANEQRQQAAISNQNSMGFYTEQASSIYSGIAAGSSPAYWRWDLNIETWPQNSAEFIERQRAANRAYLERMRQGAAWFHGSLYGAYTQQFIAVDTAVKPPVHRAKIIPCNLPD